MSICQAPETHRQCIHGDACIVDARNKRFAHCKSSATRAILDSKLKWLAALHQCSPFKGERILGQELLHCEHFSASQTCLKSLVHGFLNKKNAINRTQYASQACPAMNNVITTFFPLSATHLSQTITQKHARAQIHT